MKNRSGFTIVELLIVIVVIAILAAISIVAYNGIQTRAKTSSAQSTANSVVKKAQLFYSDKGYYPTSVNDLTNAASIDVFKLSGATFTSLSTIRASPAPSSDSINYQVCAPGNPANLAAITPSNVSGAFVYYRDYGLSGTGSEVVAVLGITSGTGMVCFTST